MDNLWSVLAQTLALSVTAAVLLAAKRLFLDKLSPRWQYGVWAILALRALLPAGLLGRTLVPGGRVVLEAARLQVELPLSSVLTDPYGVTEVLAPVPLFPFGLPVPGSITDVLFYVYAAGVLLLALWFFLSYARLRAAIRRGLSPAPEVLAQVEGVAARYGLKAPRRVVVLPGLESAFVCGPLRPVLALPGRPVDDKVLLHELLHLRHGDVWAGVGVCALRCLHWCNPLIWYCCDRIQNDCEALCDQRVLERLEGEERRAYGVILLSMADGRYARAPGTSSMANGGRNIKARIQAIARFRRYPAGMALASGCVAVVLALTCLGGTGGAAEMPGGTDRGALALAQAQLNRPTTVAGALDTYAKALLNDSPLYYAMVLPEEGREAVWKDTLVPYQEVELEDSPFWTLGFHWHRPAWQAEWSVMNLLPDGAEGYTGTLFFSPLSEDNTYGIVYQQVAVRPDGDFWTVWYAPNKADRKITLGVNTGWANEKKLLLRKKSRWWRNILQDGCVCGKRRVGPEWGTPPWRVGSAGIARREFRHWRRMGIAPNGSTARTSSAKWRRSTCPVRAVPWPSRKSIICAPGIWYWTG